MASKASDRVRAILHVLDGTAHVTNAEEEHVVDSGEGLGFSTGEPHALRREERFKMLLTMTK